MRNGSEGKASRGSSLQTSDYHKRTCNFGVKTAKNRINVLKTYQNRTQHTISILKC